MAVTSGAPHALPIYHSKTLVPGTWYFYSTISSKVQISPSANKRLHKSLQTSDNLKKFTPSAEHSKFCLQRLNKIGNTLMLDRI